MGLYIKYTFIHVECIHTYICIYIYTHTYVYIHTIHTYIYMYIYIHSYIHLLERSRLNLCLAFRCDFGDEALMKRFLFFHVQRKTHGFGTAMVCDPPETKHCWIPSPKISKNKHSNTYQEAFLKRKLVFQPPVLGAI